MSHPSIPLRVVKDLKKNQSNEELYLAYCVDVASPCPTGVTCAASDGIESDFNKIVLGSNDNVSTFDLVFYSAVEQDEEGHRTLVGGGNFVLC